MESLTVQSFVLEIAHDAVSASVEWSRALLKNALPIEQSRRALEMIRKMLSSEHFKQPWPVLFRTFIKWLTRYDMCGVCVCVCVWCVWCVCVCVCVCVCMPVAAAAGILILC
jgi:hypothetical protein